MLLVKVTYPKAKPGPALGRWASKTVYLTSTLHWLLVRHLITKWMLVKNPFSK